MYSAYRFCYIHDCGSYVVWQMGSGEVCVNYGDGCQLRLGPSSSGAVTYTDTHGQEMRYNHCHSIYIL